MLTGYGPILSLDNDTEISTKDATLAALEPESHMVKCNPGSGKYMALCLMFRGDHKPKDLPIALLKTKKTI